MEQCINFLPSERVRVFISSAQSNENGFAWRDVRKRIKDYLKRCVYLNPFIIEDEASAAPSIQFFQRQVERADVIVILVKGEVREGTATEYALASKIKKPLLVYFIESDNPNLEVIKLKKDIQAGDRCTYHPVRDFDKIEVIIRNDLMNDIIRAFQDKYFVSSLGIESPIRTEITRDTMLESSSIPTKTEIGKFSSCYYYFFDLINLPYIKKDIAPTDLHKFGCSLISWLVFGKWEVDDDDIVDFITNCSEVFQNTSWLQKRWDAIRFYFHGNLEKSLAAEEQALKKLCEDKEADWLINDTLIDCRNIQMANNLLNHLPWSKNIYQDELTSKNATIYLPLNDRYLNNIFESIRKDEFREETATPYTQLMGSSMSNVITDLANYVFTSAMYGSVTHLLLARNIFANILNRYAKIHDQPSYLFSCLRQYVLIGNDKDFKLFLESTWDNQYSHITSQADTIWELTDCIPVTYKEKMKLAVFASLGLYFTDPVFKKSSEYILGYSAYVSGDDSESYFEAILKNLHRMNPEQIIRAIIPIILEKRFHLGNKLSHIILLIDLRQVGESTLQNLAEALAIQLPYIISNNGDPQMIAPLVERNKAIFGKLETMEGNGLSGLQKSLYRINRGLGDWVTLVKEEIESARQQFEKNSVKGVFFGFANDPYLMISSIVRKERDNSEIDALILDDYIPLTIMVLNSEAALQTKESCVACLCEVLSSFYERNIELPISIKQSLQKVDVEKETDFFSSSTQKSLEIRVLMARIIVGIATEKELFRWCIEFGTLDIKEKIVIVDCLEKYLYHKKKDLRSVDSLVVSIVLQCHSANHSEIRKMAVQCLAYLVSSEYKDIAINELNKAAFDASYHVRNTLLHICQKGILPINISSNLISVLCKDANYNIRYAANKHME